MQSVGTATTTPPVDVATAPVLTKAAHDKGVRIPLGRLLPETRYSYAVEINHVLDPRVFSFATFPSAGQERSFTVAFADQDTPRPAPAYAAGAAENPAFVVQLGDLTHLAVGPKGSKLKVQDWWQLNFSATASSPAGHSFSSAIAGSFPYVHIWDDHDYGTADGDRTFKYRSQAMQAFKDDFPTYPLSSPTQGFWQSFRYAQAEVFVLDLRSPRDPDKKPDSATKSMLGATQKAWFLNGLHTSTATWKFIVSSSVWNPHSKQDDSWALFKHEQDEIVDFIRTNSITGVIFMSVGNAADEGDLGKDRLLVFRLRGARGQNRGEADRRGNCEPPVKSSPRNTRKPDRPQPNLIPGPTLSRIGDIANWGRALPFA